MIHREAWYREADRRMDELRNRAERGQLDEASAQELYRWMARTGVDWGPELTKRIFFQAWPGDTFLKMYRRMSRSGIQRMFVRFKEEMPHQGEFWRWWDEGPYSEVLQFYGALADVMEYEYNAKGYVPPKQMMELLDGWKRFEANLPKWREELFKLEKPNMEPWEIKDWQRHQKWLVKNPNALEQLEDWSELVERAREKEEQRGPGTRDFSLHGPDRDTRPITLWSLGNVLRNMINTLNSGDPFEEAFRDNWRQLPWVMKNVEDYLAS